MKSIERIVEPHFDSLYIHRYYNIDNTFYVIEYINSVGISLNIYYDPEEMKIVRTNESSSFKIINNLKVAVLHAKCLCLKWRI